MTELYAGLGWDYEDSDSSEGNKPPGDGGKLCLARYSDVLFYKLMIKSTFFLF